MAADSELLFGLVALQNGLIGQGELLAAIEAWSRDKGRPLADCLVAHGKLEAEQCAAVNAIVALRLKEHGSAGQSLAILPVGRSTRESLARMGDPDITETLALVGPGSSENDNLDRAGSFAVGTVTSGGQRFRILRPHARGGLGAVFVALDTELNREVALKQILDHHADDEASRYRFLLEAEITGGLEHPGIVPVYGLGNYENGRPYYAMRFVRGDSLKEAMERFHAEPVLKSDAGKRSLELRKLLRRLTDVCNAVDYAHSRGVLHRDIKPGNVIIGRHGEVLVVDWGLAKATGRTEPGALEGERALSPSSASGSAATLPGSAMGTPAYMSPEQAAGEIERLGPASDVYSLGATLYCLLTGRPPFASSDVAEVLGAVQRGEFAPPRAVDRSIDRALEAICLKAMALHASERYDSPRAMADDVERWMADEPVSARLETRSERLSRWMRRHREWARAGVAALVLVAVVSVAAALAIDVARGAERAARDRATKALSAESIALEAERAAKSESEANFQTARQAVEDYLTTVSESVLLKQQYRADLRALRKQLLDGALAYYQGFIMRHKGDARLLAESADAYTRVGSITSEIGSKEEALRSYEQAREIRQMLVEANPSDVPIQSALARDNLAIGQLERETGRVEEAMRSFEQAREIRQRLVAKDPGAPDLKFDLAESHQRIGVLLYEGGRADLALLSFERSSQILGRLIETNPVTNRFQKALGDLYHNTGILYDQSGRAVEGLQAYKSALTIRQKLAEANPSVTEFQSDLANTCRVMGMLQRETGSTDDAMRSYDRSLAIQRKLVDANPSVTEFQSNLARLHNSIGLLERSARRPDNALRSFERTLELQQKLSDANPSVTEFQSDLAATLMNIGMLHHDAGRVAEALKPYERARRIQRKLVDDNPSVTEYSRDLAWNLKNSGLLERRTGRTGDARQSFELAVAIWDKLENPSAVVLYLKASALAQISDLIGQEPPGPATADRAMQTLRQAVTAGYRDLFSYRGDITLDPLRSRPDFELFLMDLAMPADPFTK